MIKKLRRKFVLVNMIIVTVMLTVIFGLILFFTERNLEQEGIQLMHSIASMPAPPEHSSGINGRTPPSVFTIRKTPYGEYRAFGSEVYDLSDNELLNELYDTARNEGTQTGVLKEYKLRFFIKNTPMTEEIIFTDISGEQTVLLQLLQTCILISVLSFGAFLVISIILARWMVKPVEDAWNQQKQFVADASHELKTPLTVIMTNAEMLQDTSYSSEKHMQFSENILTMSRQMRGLTESLLELARSDNNSSKIVLKDIDFSQLTADSILPFEPLYFEKGLTLRCEINSGVVIKGDSHHLSRLVDILLDNAMKYTYPETEVVIRLKKRSSSCILSVESCGNTISKAELKNIFKRFYRIDKARSMNHSYGLGLSIAESIVKGHDGKIWAESVNNVNTFYVKLPLSSVENPTDN